MRHSLKEVEELRSQGEDKTRPGAPEAEPLGADFWKSARVVLPQAKPPSTCASIAISSNGSDPTEKATSPA